MSIYLQKMAIDPGKAVIGLALAGSAGLGIHHGLRKKSVGKNIAKAGLLTGAAGVLLTVPNAVRAIRAGWSTGDVLLGPGLAAGVVGGMGVGAYSLGRLAGYGIRKITVLDRSGLKYGFCDAGLTKRKTP